MPKETWKCFTANEILLAHHSIHKITEPLGTIPTSIHFLNKLEEHIGFLSFSCQLILELWRTLYTNVFVLCSVKERNRHIRNQPSPSMTLCHSIHDPIRDWQTARSEEITSPRLQCSKVFDHVATAPNLTLKIIRLAFCVPSPSLNTRLLIIHCH